MRVSRSFLLLLPLLALAACTDEPDPFAPDAATASVPARFGAGIGVMSQNMYLGAHIDLLLSAQSPDDVGLVFQQLGTSTLVGGMGAPVFGRAFAMARQIAMEAPHLVGLQEVTRYDMETGGQTQVLDYIQVLQGFLGYFHQAFGTPLYTVVRQDWTSVYFPASIFNPALPNVTYTDGEAILVRSDVQLIGDPIAKAYDAAQPLSVAGFEFDYRRGYLSVLANVDGQVLRFVTTHLEVQRFEAVQLAQTAELIAAFAASPVPVIMVGDFNSAANHDAPESQESGSYRMLRQAGFADIWLRQPQSVGGYTCCQAADLTNAQSQLTQRLDLVLVRWGKAGFGGHSTMQVIGEEPADRIGLGAVTLWPADHAAVAATLWPAPGRSR